MTAETGEAYVHLEAVHLSYSNLAYRNRSLKSAVLNTILRRKEPHLADVEALKDVTVSIERGERVALLGHNGSGKTTLLKVIAGVYPISSGTADVAGAIRSLFDLNLGFESDATGRENILFRGLLMGHNPTQMMELTPEIIEVADIGDFIEYPIKTYSAGMIVRLAFAISTAIHGDILLLDEVIGAGDANFMMKAKARILRLIDRAEIMVLASHDLHSVGELCTRAVVLDHGELIFDGAVADGITKYQQVMGVGA